MFCISSLVYMLFSVLLLSELSQIASEFNAHCGSGTKRMKRDVFASFVSKIGISPNAVDNLYRCVSTISSGTSLIRHLCNPAFTLI